MRGRTFLTQKGMKYMGSHWLNDDDLKEFCSILPHFQLQQFHSWMKVNNDVISYLNELIFFPYTYYGSLGQIAYHVSGFHCASIATKKYREWYGTDDRIFMRPYIKKISKPLKYCKELFDKDVLEIKKTCKRHWRSNSFDS